MKSLELLAPAVEVAKAAAEDETASSAEEASGETNKKRRRPLEFFILTNESSSRKSKVCERAMLNIIGLTRDATQREPDQWTSAKNSLFDPEGDAISRLIKTSQKAHRYDTKSESSRQFIKFVGNKFSDLSPMEGMEHVHILPYETPEQAHRSYQLWDGHADGQPLAGIDTFKAALKNLKATHRLLRCKGSFPTCGKYYEQLQKTLSSISCLYIRNMYLSSHSSSSFRHMQQRGRFVI